MANETFSVEQIKESLTRKLGPLPVWGWGAIVLVGLLYYRYTHPSSDAEATYDDGLATSAGYYDYGPATGSAGGGSTGGSGGSDEGTGDGKDGKDKDKTGHGKDGKKKHKKGWKKGRVWDKNKHRWVDKEDQTDSKGKGKKGKGHTGNPRNRNGRGNHKGTNQGDKKGATGNNKGGDYTNDTVSGKRPHGQHKGQNKIPPNKKHHNPKPHNKQKDPSPTPPYQKIGGPHRIGPIGHRLPPNPKNNGQPIRTTMPVKPITHAGIPPKGQTERNVAPVNRMHLPEKIQKAESPVRKKAGKR